MALTEKQIVELIEQDDYMMNVIRAVQTLSLPDWWVCAGFVRAKIWDTLHGYTSRTPTSDVDVVYFDTRCVQESEEKRYEAMLRNIMPEVPWSVKNEARMHLINGIPPYCSAVDAISKFPETVTCLGVTIDESGELCLAAPHGIEDVTGFHVQPTPYFNETEERAIIYETRIQRKNWTQTWNKVRVTHSRFYTAD